MSYFQLYEKRRNRYSRVQPGSVWIHQKLPGVICKILAVNLEYKSFTYEFRYQNGIWVGSIETLIKYYYLVKLPDVEVLTQ